MKRYCVILFTIAILLGGNCLPADTQAPPPPPTYGPMISSLPDIFLGDMEDGDSLNLFQFNNILNLYDFVEDLDTTDSAIIWSFREEDTIDHYEMNGVTQLDPGQNPGYPPPSKWINSVTPWLSIRDIMASPHGQDPGPYSGPLHTRVVTLYASDGVYVTSDSIVIQAVDGGYDTLVRDELTTGGDIIPLKFIEMAVDIDFNAGSDGTVSVSKELHVPFNINKPAIAKTLGITTNKTGVTGTNVEFHYSDAEIGGLDESRLRVFQSATGTSDWAKVPTQTPDPADNKITITIDSFSYFGIAEEPFALINDWALY